MLGFVRKILLYLYQTYSKITNYMKIPEELLKKWDGLRSHGDHVKIAAQNQKVTNMDISRAINTGECSDLVFDAIAGFYKEKEEKVKEYL